MKTWKTGLSILLLAWVVCAVAPAASADNVPSVINYQGKLFDPAAGGGAGAAITGVQQVEFRIWDALTGGTIIWGRRFPVSCTADGTFNVLLNDGGTWLSGVTNNLRDAFAGEDRYLELTVQGYGTAISPRQQLVSAPYAMHSAHASEAQTAATGFTVNQGLTVSSGGANITGVATLQSNLTVHGTTTLSSPLTVNSSATITGALTVDGNLTVVTPSTINGYGTVPIGGILMWSGATNAIPDGWALCDGGTHEGHVTPNLRDRFIVGSGTSYTNGQTGGEGSHTLTPTEMPAHGHDTSVKTVGYAASWNDHHEAIGAPSQSRNNGTETLTIAHAGGNAAHENRPPFYALAYIMRVK